MKGMGVSTLRLPVQIRAKVAPKLVKTLQKVAPKLVKNISKLTRNFVRRIESHFWIL